MGEHLPGQLVLNSTTLSDQEKENILGKNALEFFGSLIDRSKFEL